MSSAKLWIVLFVTVSLGLAGGNADAQRRGNREGQGGGDRGQNGPQFSGGGDERGGQRESFEGNRDGNQGSRRSFDGGSFDRAMSRANPSRQFDSEPRSQRSYYRGPDGSLDRNDNTDRRDNASRSREFRELESDNRGRVNDRNRISNDDWRRHTEQFRSDWWNRNRNDLPFRSGWWDGYSNDWPAYGPWRYSRWNDRPYYWWSWTPAPRLINWLAFEGRPRYWEYGPGRNVYYRDNYIYYDNRQVMTADAYYQEVFDLAHNLPDVDSQAVQDMDWSPLGVFALMREDESQGTRLLQLAVDRQGILSGTYHNQQDGTAHPVAGRVDKRTQRAAWAFADGQQQDVVFETSLYSLTAPESTMMVHFGPGADSAEVWRMVRLKQPSVPAGSTIPTPRTGRTLP